MSSAPDPRASFRYAQVMLGGNVVIMLLFVINAVFRGAGDAAIAMRVLWIANGVNILLDPLLIFGWGPFPELGITGAAVAGATITIRLMMLTLMPAWGMSNAAATLVGIFSDDPEVIAVGGEWVRILSYSYFVYGWWMVAVQAFNGAGDTRTPTLINVAFFWMIQIPLSWWLATYLGWAESGVFWGVFISETAVGVFTLWLFSRGGWKNTRV